MSRLTKQEIKAIEELGWSVDIDETGYYCLRNCSPCGGDMTIEAQDREEIINYCKCYDAEEEFNCWYGANNGEPHCPGDLWKDCLDKGDMYKQLKNLLTK